MLYSLRRWVILLSLVVCWAAFVHCEDVVADKQSDVAAEKQSEAVADKTLTWNSAVAASNFNQFKTNLDRAQEFLLHLYQGAYGGVSAFWFYYSYWLILSAFYYTFGVTYLNAKDEAEAAGAKEDSTIGRSLSGVLSNIDLPFILNSLKEIHERSGSGSTGQPCYQRGFCEMRSYLSTTWLYRVTPVFIRRVLKLEPNSRQAGSCAQLHPGCTWQSIASKFLQLK